MRSINETNYLSLVEAAQRLNAHPNSVRRWVDRGELPAVRIGGRLYVTEGMIADYLGQTGPAKLAAGVNQAERRTYLTR